MRPPKPGRFTATVLSAVLASLALVVPESSGSATSDCTDYATGQDLYTAPVTDGDVLCGTSGYDLVESIDGGTFLDPEGGANVLTLNSGTYVGSGGSVETMNGGIFIGGDRGQVPSEPWRTADLKVAVGPMKSRR